MGSSSLDFALDVPWVAAYAAEPFELLRVVYPHLNASTLPPPTNPIRIARHYLDKRASCGTTTSGGTSSNGNSNGSSNSNDTTKKSSNTGVLVGAVVGAVVGTAIIAGLVFWLYRRSQRNRQQQQGNNFNNPSNGNTPFKDDSPPMPTPFVHPAVTGTPPPPTATPPGMKQVSPYDVPGLNYTSAMYPAPPSTIGSGPASSYGNPSDRASYYNYAPPPPSSPQPTISSGTGISYYAGTPAPPFMSHPSSTPSPPPPSMTSGPTSVYSGISSNASYQPWAVPLDQQAQAGSNYATANATGGATSIPGVFAAGAFPTAHEEKAHFSGWQPHQQLYSPPGASGSGAGSGSGFPSGTTSEKAGLKTGMEKAGPSIANPVTDSGPTASSGGGGGSGERQGAMSPTLDTSGRNGAASPTPGLPPPAYSPQYSQ